jgi:hypothetical protein
MKKKKRNTLNLISKSFAISTLFMSAYSFAQTTIPVHYLVAAVNNGGTQAQASLEELENGIAQLNSGYAAIDVNFVIDKVSYITNDDVSGINDGSWDTDDEEDVRPFFIYGNLNVIVADLDGLNGHAYRHEEATDVIEVEPENLSTSTIVHEFGHNLSLSHTYSGVDDAPTSQQEGLLGWKYGDGVIDTPVDPGSRSNFDECIYESDDVDSEGVAFSPDGFNYMGKGQNTCRNKYSPQQLRRISKILATDKFHLSNRYGVDANPTCSNSALVNQFPHRDGLNYNEEITSAIWTQDAFNDNFNWSFSFDTGSSNTGANGPVEGHSFIHIDSGNGLLSANDSVNLLSPCYDFSNESSAYAEFFFQMYGEDTGTLSLAITVDDGETWIQLWALQGQQQSSGANWTKAVVNLSDYVQKQFQLRLSGQVLGGSKGDISVDTISVSVEEPSSDQPFPSNSETVTAELTVITGSDDAEEEVSNGEMSIDSSDLELVDESGRTEQLVGVRFAEANIPKGATISEARIQFMADDTNSEQTDLIIKGHLSSTSSAFTENDNDISRRLQTSSFTTWSPASWTEDGDAGGAQQTTPLTQIVQELVNQESWSSESAITFIISGDGEREAESFEGGSSKAPRLTITYSEANSVLGDWDKDGDVDINDIRGVIITLLSGQSIDDSFDLNKDGVVNQLDSRAMMRICTRENCQA